MDVRIGEYIAILLLTKKKIKTGNSSERDFLLFYNYSMFFYHFQPVIAIRIYVLHKITIALKFMFYMNSDLLILAKKLQTPG